MPDDEPDALAPRTAGTAQRVGTRDLEQIIQRHGLSQRKSRRFLKAVLSKWIQALRRGEPVEVPGGELYAPFQTDSSRQRLVKLRKGNGPLKYVLRPRVGRRRVIIFRPRIEFDD